MDDYESCLTKRLSDKSTGMWVAWNREQTQIVATGRTLDEAKQAGAKAGHRAMIITKVSPRKSRSGYSLAIVYAVAVFVAQAVPLLSAS